jgi:hypothetical protein
MWFHMKYIAQNGGWRILMSIDCILIESCVDDQELA